MAILNTWRQNCFYWRLSSVAVPNPQMNFDRRSFLRRSASCAAIALLVVAIRADATNLYWDVNGSSTGATNGTTAAGTWDNATSANWSTNSAGTSTTKTTIRLTEVRPQRQMFSFLPGPMRAVVLP